MKLSELNIRKAKPSDKPRTMFDGGGLYILIEPTVGKLWRFKYRFEGKYRLMALGRGRQPFAYTEFGTVA